MNRKYKIVSAYTIMPMVIYVRKQDSEEMEPIIMSIGVNYSQDKIIFNGELLDGIDYEDLEQEILAYLRPATVETPVISKDIMDRVRKVRSGEYQSAFSQPEFNK